MDRRRGSRTTWSLALVLVPLLAPLLALGCSDVASSKAKHRERDASRDRECKDATKPRAFFYPAENRTDYRPDDPHRDRCELLVADHLFCCPEVSRATDR